MSQPATRVWAGNQAYERGDFRAAVEAYREALAAGVDSADLWFNLGNAHYRAGDLGEAALAWERALRREPGDGTAREHLSLLRSQQGVSASAPLSLRVASRIPGDLAAGALLGSWLIFWLLLLGRRRLQGWRRVLSDVAAGLLAALVLISGAATYAAWQVREAGWAVVLQEVAVHAQADAKEEVSSLPAGALVREVEGRGERVRIEAPGGVEGWVPAEAIERIERPRHPRLDPAP